MKPPYANYTIRDVEIVLFSAEYAIHKKHSWHWAPLTRCFAENITRGLELCAKVLENKSPRTPREVLSIVIARENYLIAEFNKQVKPVITQFPTPADESYYSLLELEEFFPVRVYAEWDELQYDAPKLLVRRPHFGGTRSDLRKHAMKNLSLRNKSSTSTLFTQAW